MKVFCPHCGTVLPIPSKTKGKDWAMTQCRTCSKHSVIQVAEFNQAISNLGATTGDTLKMKDSPFLPKKIRIELEFDVRKFFIYAGMILASVTTLLSGVYLFVQSKHIERATRAQKTPVVSFYKWEESSPVKKPEVISDQVKTTQAISQPVTNFLNKISVRSGPSEMFPVLSSLNEKDSFQVIAREGNWLRIELSGKKGWISSSSAALSR